MRNANIVCPKCGEASLDGSYENTDPTAWQYHEDAFECELCGTHPGIECPKCHERFDDIYFERKRYAKKQA